MTPSRSNYGQNQNNQYGQRQNSSPPGRGGGNPHHSGGSDPDIEEILRKIKSLKNLSELTVEDIAKEGGIAEKLANNRQFRTQLKTTQLRKFFDSIVNNQERLKTSGWASIESEFYMIRPNLAYAKGRKLIPEEFFKLVSNCLEKVNTTPVKGELDEKQLKDNYDRFVELMQALVAYTKYFER